MDFIGEWLKRPSDFVIVPAAGLGAAHLEYLYDLVAGEPIGPVTVAWGAMLVTLGLKRLTFDRIVDARNSLPAKDRLRAQITDNLDNLAELGPDLSKVEELMLSDLASDFERVTSEEDLANILERVRALRNEILAG